MTNLLTVTDENRCPDCLFMKLGKTKERRSDFTLTITGHFDYQKIEFFGGTLIAAIKSGDIRISLNNCSFGSFLVYNELAWEVSKTITLSGSDTTKSSILKNSKVGVSGLKPMIEQSSQAQVMNDVSASGQVSTSFITKSVNAIQGLRPGWRFRNETQEAYITGSFVSVPFATIKIPAVQRSSSPTEVVAVFEVLQRDIYVEIVDGVALPKYTQDMNKSKVLNLLLWKWIIKPRFYPFVSKVHLR